MLGVGEGFSQVLLDLGVGADAANIGGDALDLLRGPSEVVHRFQYVFVELLVVRQSLYGSHGFLERRRSVAQVHDDGVEMRLVFREHSVGGSGELSEVFTHDLGVIAECLSFRSASLRK